MSDPVRNKQDLVLAPGEYAYLQDTTKGTVRVYTGPTVATPSAQDVPVIYDPKTNSFRNANSLAEAICHSPLAKEGNYLALTNPAKNGSHPDENSKAAPELETGRQVNVPGPITFALWPTQSAQVIEGHKLRSNEYLLLQVYNEEEAKKNWHAAIQKGIAGSEAKVGEAPKDLTIGKLFIIKGTEVSFYIPPTGIMVVPEENGEYVRDAITLERLEYCILLDEGGRKRYERGPQVVFPEPTERFMEKKEEKGTHRKFKAIELNEIQGLHLKCIAAFTDENGRSYKVGEEIFITGKDTSIFYPREELAEVRYDGKSKHFATAVPKGEGRYILKRKTGNIDMVEGPAMLLPVPIDEVLVRRVLSPRECEVLYPGNAEVMEYNQALQAIQSKAPTTRAGAISEGDFERGSRSLTKGVRGAAAAPAAAAAYLASTSNFMPDRSEVSRDVNLMSGDEFSRASTYTDPRTVTLNTKYQGAPRIDIWTGYAVQVVSKDNSRRVVVGPSSVLLQYDETLEALLLSTGKPKNTDTLLTTGYLRVENNQVSDIIQAVTADHVGIQMKLSYRVNFEGDSTKWFKVENYVKLLTDHARSVLKGALRQVRVEEFYANAEQLIRDIILGKSEGGSRKGMPFDENGMRVIDVEVLTVVVGDDNIRKMLDSYQHEVISSNINILSAKRQLEVETEKEGIKRQLSQLQADTRTKTVQLEIEGVSRDLELFMARMVSTTRQVMENTEIEKLKIQQGELGFVNELDRDKRAHELKESFERVEQERAIQLLKAEADAIVLRFNAVQGQFAEALTVLSNNEALEKVAQALSAQMLFGGKDVASVVTKVFEGTPLQAVMARVMEGAGKAPANGGSLKPPIQPTR